MLNNVYHINGDESVMSSDYETPITNSNEQVPENRMHTLESWLCLLGTKIIAKKCVINMCIFFLTEILSGRK